MPDDMAQYIRDNMKTLAPLLAGRIWSPAPGLSRYLISNFGEVLSLVRKKPKILKPIYSGKYLGMRMAHDGGRLVDRYIHRLVLEAFVGDPLPGQESRHLDGDPTRNELGNLAWGTRQENHDDKRRHGTTAAGERNPMARLTMEQVKEMRLLYGSGGWTFKSLAKRFEVSAMTAHRAVRKETWNG